MNRDLFGLRSVRKGERCELLEGELVALRFPTCKSVYPYGHMCSSFKPHKAAAAHLQHPLLAAAAHR